MRLSARRFRAEARLEPARLLAALERVDRHAWRHDAELHQLLPVLVADVHGLGRCFLEVEPYLRHRMVGLAAHAGRGVFRVPVARARLWRTLPLGGRRLCGRWGWRCRW